MTVTSKPATARGKAPYRPGSAWKKILRHWQLYVLISIPFLQLVIFKYIPMAGLQIAFRKYRSSLGIWESPWVGLKNFIKFFNSPTTPQIIWNTVSISMYTIIASFPLAIILAIALNEARSKRFKKSVQMATYAPYFISTVVLVSMISQLFEPRIGVIGMLLRNFGIDIGNVMGNADAFKHLYVWSGVWQANGYNAILYLAALTNISPELHEAAVVDGCNKFQRIQHVDLPGILPTVLTMLILNMGYVMSVGFEKVYLMQSPATLSVSEVISTYTYRIGITNSDYSYSTAIGFANSLINLTLMSLVNFITKRITGQGMLF